MIFQQKYIARIRPCAFVGASLVVEWLSPLHLVLGLNSGLQFTKEMFITGGQQDKLVAVSVTFYLQPL